MSGEQQNPFLLDEEDEALYENIWEQDIEVQRFGKLYLS
jgi:hypothetical protein